MGQREVVRPFHQGVGLRNLISAVVINHDRDVRKAVIDILLVVCLPLRGRVTTSASPLCEDVEHDDLSVELVHLDFFAKLIVELEVVGDVTLIVAGAL